MMDIASKLHRNAIQTGCIDCYCLACEQHLRSEQDALYHLKLPIHEKNLQPLRYLTSFQGDLIRKVKTGFYCEFCNKRLPTLSIVRLHVADCQHLNNKGRLTIQRIGDVILAPGNIVINEMAWNGFKDQSCALCSTEYLDIDMHRSEKKHALNLIEKVVQFDGHNNIYRQIEDVSFHCLTCNMLYASSDLNDHFSSTAHKEKYAKCQNYDFLSDEKTDGFSTVDHIDKCSDISSEEYVDAVEELTISSPIRAQLNQKIDGGNNTVDNNKPKTANNTNEINNNNFQNQKKEDENNRKYRWHNNNRYDKQINESYLIGSKNNGVERLIGAIEAKITPTRGTLEVVANEVINEVNNDGNGIDVSHNVSSEEDNPCDPKEINVSEIIRNLYVYQKNGVDVNFEIELAFCKICFEHLELDADYLNHHISKHNKNMRRGTHELVYPQVHTYERTEVFKKKNIQLKMIEDLKKDSESKSELISDNESARTSPSESKKKPESTEKYESTAAEREADYATENKITYNKGVGQAFCRICETRLPSTLRSMKEHVSGARHKKASCALGSQSMPKKYLKTFMESNFRIENIFGLIDVVINEKYCMAMQSYQMITESLRGGYRCQICQSLSVLVDWKIHVENPLHQFNILNMNVLWGLSTEFIREVQPDIFHCGFCNLITGNYDRLTDHLNSSIHKETKSACNRRLELHMPGILKYKQRNFFRNFPYFY